MSNGEEKEESSKKESESLEEKFERLRGEGVEDKEIIKQIFNENLNADVSEICRITGLDKLTVGRAKGQIARWAKKPSEPETPALEEIKKTEETETGGVPPLEKSGMTSTEYVAYYGLEGLDELKRRRLVELLASAPGIGKRTIEWVSKQWQLDPSVRKDLNQLLNVLTGCGVKNDIAYRICNVLASMDEEYASVLRRGPAPMGFYPTRDVRGEGGYPQFRQPQSYGGEPFPQRFPQPQYPQPPYYDYYPPQGYPPRVEDIVRQRVDEELKKREPQSQPSQAQQVVTITEPLRDAEGKLVYDKDGNPVYRKVTGPMSQVGVVSQEDPEMRILKKGQMWRDLFGSGKQELTEDKMRAVMREESGKKEEKLTKEDIEKASTGAALRVLATREEEDKEEKRFERLERAIRESAGGKTVEGYHDDAYRFLGQGLQTFATREPKTAKVVTDFLERIMYGQAPPSKEIEQGARESIFERLDKKYVAEE